MKFLAKFRNVGLAAVAVLLAVTSALAQGGSQHYNSPLYSPRTYDPTVQQTQSSGLPEALQTVGIEQRLNEQLPLVTKFVDETGKAVTLGDYFGKGKPVVLALVYYECRSEERR